MSKGFKLVCTQTKFIFANFDPFALLRPICLCFSILLKIRDFVCFVVFRALARLERHRGVLPEDTGTALVTDATLRAGNGNNRN